MDRPYDAWTPKGNARRLEESGAEITVELWDGTIATFPSRDVAPRPWSWAEPELILGVKTSDGTVDRTLSLSDEPANGKLLMALARRRKAHRRPGTDMIELLALRVDRWGPHDFTEMPIPKRRSILLGSAVADIIAAVIFYRYREMGADYAVEWACPVCSAPPVTVGWSLEELQVRGDRSGNVVDVDLSRPLRKGQLAALRAGPPTWRGMTSGGVSDSREITRSLLRSAVLAGKSPAGQEVPIAPGEWDDLHLRDYGALERAVDGHAQIDLKHDVVCAGCNSTSVVATVVEVDFFFGSSSTCPR